MEHSGSGSSLSRPVKIPKIAMTHTAGIAQLGEQQTEVLEVPCSIHGPGIVFASQSKTRKFADWCF
jgi:hypothetical protein